MDVIIDGNKLYGLIKIPSSKSVFQRVLLASLLADGDSVITGYNNCFDVKEALGIVESLTNVKRIDENKIVVSGGIKIENNHFKVSESATTLRLFLPALTYLLKEVTFELGENLYRRPLSVYQMIIEENLGLFIKNNNKLTIKQFPKLTKYLVSGKISSQFISGLLFLMPLFEMDSVIEVTDELTSKEYIKITIDVLSKFNIEVKWDKNCFYVKGGQKYQACEIEIPLDYSLYANIWGMNQLGANINVLNDCESLEPEYAFIKSLKNFNEITYFDLSDIPDIAPVLAVLCALKSKKCVHLANINRIKYKETNRIKTISDNLNSIGGDVSYTDNEIIINPIKNFTFGVINGEHDHRIVMMGIIASVFCKVRINNFESINKSYPDLLNELVKIGLEVELCKE